MKYILFNKVNPISQLVRLSILSTGLICTTASAQIAATTHVSTLGSDRIETAQTLFNRELWNDCLDRLNEAQTQELTIAEQEEYDYMMAIASFRQNHTNSLYLLQNYLKKYRASVHSAEVQLELGTYYLFNYDPQKALSEFNKITAFDLAQDKQHILFFRIGQAYIETAQYDKARPYYQALIVSDDPEYSSDASYYIAYLDYLDKNYDSALQKFGSLPATDKYKQTASVYIVQILYHQNKWDDALSQAQQIINYKGISTTQKVELYRIIGECYLQKNDKAEALKYLKMYMDSSSPIVATSAYNCGVLAYENKEIELATKALSKISLAETTDDTINQKAYMLLGQIYMDNADYNNARMAFERASEMSNDAATQEAAAYNYAVMVHETAYSPFNEEITVFENFLNKYPNSVYADNASTYLVEVYMTTHNYASALQSIDKIKRPTAKIMSAKQRLLYQMGLQEYVNGNRNEAVKYFTQCINLRGYNAGTQGEAYYWRGEAYYNDGQYAKAEFDYKQFNIIKPTGDASHLASGYYNLGYAQFKQNKFANAISAFKTYVEYPSERNSDTYIDALSRLGDCYYYNRDFSLAETYYSASADANSTNTADYALFQKAFMEGLQKKYTLKLANLDALIKKYPESEWIDEAYLERGKTYVLLENSASAINEFSEVVNHYAAKSTAPQAGLQLALVYYNAGKLNNAIDAYKHVIAVYPGSDEAQIALEDLKNIYVEKNEVPTYAAYLKTLDGKVPMATDEQDSLTYVAATHLFARGQNAKAEQALKDYLQEYPNGQYAVEANITLARAYKEAKNYDKALNHYIAIAIVPGCSYMDEALSSMAYIYIEQNKLDKAFESYFTLATSTDNADYKRTALMGCTRIADELNKPQDVIQCFTLLNEDASISHANRQEGLLLRGKAYLALNQLNNAYKDLTAAASDTRSAFGSEAKYRLAQLYFDDNKVGEAETQVFELINSATPHQYWLARGFILLGDIALGRGDKFQAKQYMQSLQSNYNSNEEINKMIQNRLSKCEE